MDKSYLAELYASDPKFISTYHEMKNMTLEFCIDDTWNTIKDAENHTFDFGYFTVDTKQDLIPRLTGFFIKPEYRNKETFERFYKEVCKRMPKYFMACSHRKNLKLINFFKKFGAETFDNNEKDIIHFIFKQENL